MKILRISRQSKFSNDSMLFRRNHKLKIQPAVRHSEDQQNNLSITEIERELLPDSDLDLFKIEQKYLLKLKDSTHLMQAETILEHAPLLKIDSD